MKKFQMLILGAAALLAASCSNDAEPMVGQTPEGKPVVLRATIESTSRAAIDNGKVNWQAEDKISVRLSDGSNLEMTVTEESVGKTAATFSGVIKGEAKLNVPTVAVYPSNDEHVLADGAVQVNMPDTYTVADNANTNMPMICEFDANGSGTFKHLGGVIQFKIGMDYVPAGAAKFRFTARDKKNITGLFSITKDANGDYIAATEGNGERSSVTIAFNADQIVNNVLTVNVPLPVGTYAGMDLDILDANGVKLMETFGTSATNTVKRAGRIAMPKLTPFELSVSTETDYTDEQVIAAINEGTDITINNAIAKLDLTQATATGNVALNLNAPVGEIVLANETDNTITINVAKDVDYPSISLVKGHNIKNISIIGDPTSSKSLTSGLDALNSGVTTIENVLFDGVRFEDKGIRFGYSANPQTTYNITIQNCVAENMSQIFFTLAHNGYDDTKVGNITIKNNRISYLSTAESNANGLNIRFATEGTILIEGNTIENVKYHGIMMENNLSEVIIRNNTISATKDGIKMDYPAGTTTITGNNVTAKEHIIRIARFKAANTPSMTITGNTINVTEMGYADNEEFYGICFGTSTVETGATATLVVKDNVKVGTVTPHNAWFFCKETLGLNTGSDIATPYAE